MTAIQRHVGRLIEIDFPAEVDMPFTSSFAADAVAIVTDIAKAGQRAVSVADMSKTKVMPADAIRPLADMLKADNPAIERTAIVIGSDPLVDLQIWRLLSDADSDARRSFTNPDDALRWLHEVVSDPAEQERLQAFFSERF